jgi:hypothetical protein
MLIVVVRPSRDENTLTAKPFFVTAFWDRTHGNFAVLKPSVGQRRSIRYPAWLVAWNIAYSENH